jgi:hypothetical protein
MARMNIIPLPKNLVDYCFQLDPTYKDKYKHVLTELKIFKNIKKLDVSYIISELPLEGNKNKKIIKEIISKSPQYYEDLVEIFESKQDNCNLYKFQNHYNYLNNPTLNRDIILLTLSKKPDLFSIIPENFKNDEGLLSLVLKYNATLLQDSPKKNDKRFVMKALKKNLHIISYASDELKQDSDIIDLLISLSLQKINKNVNNFKKLPYEAKDIYPVAEQAIVNNPAMLEFCTERIKNDKHIIKFSLKRNCTLFLLLPNHFQNDEELKQIVLERYLKKIEKNGNNLQHAPEFIKKNKQFVLKAISSKSNALQYASSELQNDKEIVLRAVSKHGLSLQYASTELQNDKEIVLQAVSNHGISLKYASTELQNDKEIVLRAVSKHSLSLQYASEKLQNEISVA